MAGIATTKEYSIHSYEVDLFYHVLPEVILRYMQDVAMEQSETLGVGREFLEKHQMYWIVTRYHIKFLAYPKYKDNIKVTTKAVGFKKIFAFREFTVTNEQGELLVQGKSQWMLLDRLSHKFLKIREELYQAYGVDKEKRQMMSFDKLLLPEKTAVSKNYRACYSDIDINRHVNNTRYLSWAMDTIPEKYFMDYTLEEFDIVFKKEVLYNQTVTVHTDMVDSPKSAKGYHEIQSEEGELICNINTMWTFNKKILDT